MNHRTAVKMMPDDLIDDYTLNKRIPIGYMYLDNVNGREPQSVRIWNDDYTRRFVDKCTPSNIRNIENTTGNYDDAPGPRLPYGDAVLRILNMLEKHNITNKKVAVVGSAYPWIEALLLNMNNEVTTIEYGVSEEQQKSENYNLTLKDYFRDFKKTVLPLYDAIVTFSSVEHSGLGRYGDPLSPTGDIETMKTIHKNLKPDGILIWGAPVGHDAVIWNAHRIYGKIRLPLLFAKFTEIEWDRDKIGLLSQPFAYCAYQPIVVLKPN